MNNYFTHTLADLTFKKISTHSGVDENHFVADLFNEKLSEIGHIHLIPAQNQVRITASMLNGEQKIYYITKPRIEFLKFIFENTNQKIKKSIRFYFQNSPDAQNQSRESKDQE
jgi:hypothetical protein